MSVTIASQLRNSYDTKFLSGILLKVGGKWFYTYTHNSHNWTVAAFPLEVMKAWPDISSMKAVTFNLQTMKMDEIELASNHLGYVNYKNMMPKYLKIKTSGGGMFGAGPSNLDFGGLHSNQAYYSLLMGDKAFADMLENTYPTRQEAWAFIMSDSALNWRAQAFHREFCFERSGFNTVRLHYKGNPVGEMLSADKARLYPARDHLTRKLMLAAGIPHVETFSS